MRTVDLPSLAALRTFEAAARHLSFKNAADELNVTASAVSRQIKALEAEIGLPLFQRGYRQVALTPEGRELSEVLARSFAEIAHCVGALRGQRQGRRITVGATSAFTHYWLMPRLGRFWARHDSVVDHVLSDREADLTSSRIDLSIRYGAGPWDGQDSARLFADLVYPVAAPDQPEVATVAADLSALLDARLIELSGVDARWLDWSGFLPQVGLTGRARRRRHVNSYIIAVEAAMNGQGVTLGWHRLVRPLVEAGRLVRVGSGCVWTPHAYHVTWRRNRTLPPEIAAFRDWLLEEAASEDGPPAPGGAGSRPATSAADQQGPAVSPSGKRV